MTNREIERRNPETVAAIAEHYRQILTLLGEDPQREGLVKTPERAAKAMLDATMGYVGDAEGLATKAIFEHTGTGIVIVKDIEFYSLCEHHILPFFGRISVGYLPKGKIIGLSKLARIVNVYAKRLQVQERLTEQICTFLTRMIPNRGVMVACTAEHLCMKMRGVEKQESATVTTECSGDFLNSPELRAEFMRLTGL